VKLAQKLVLVVKSLEVWNFSSAVGELQMPTDQARKCQGQARPGGPQPRLAQPQLQQLASSLHHTPNTTIPHSTESHTHTHGMMEDSNRLFRFPKPAWMNSANTRTAGVYIAGALVRASRMPHLHILLTMPRSSPWGSTLSSTSRSGPSRP